VPTCAANESDKAQKTSTMPNRRTCPIVVRYGQEVSIRNQAREQDAREQIREAAEIIDPTWLIAVRAALEKKAHDVVVLDLREITTLADHFVICSGANARQNQAICDEIHLNLKEAGDLPTSLEGYDNAEWILMDYGDLIVHIFLDKARSFYDLERLWRHGKRVDLPLEGATEPVQGISPAQTL
jgi:ribosome-associated protein